MRLVLAVMLATAALLALVGTFLYIKLASDLSNALDLELRQRAQDLRAALVDPALTLDRLAGSGLVEHGESFAEVLSPNGRVLDSTGSLGGSPLLDPAELQRAQHGVLTVDRSRVPGLDEPARLLAIPVLRGQDLAVLVVGGTQQNRAEALGSVRSQLLVGGPVLLLVATGGSFLLAGAALHPVDAMRRQAESITAEERGQRLPVPPAHDELFRLGATLNNLLARVEAALARERSFVAHASHELRTPLASLRTELELALRHERSPAELRAAISSAGEETRRMQRLADDLLLRARADEDGLPIRRERIDTAVLFERVAREVGAPNDRRVRADAADVPVLEGDPVRLQQALRNLVDNALRHGTGEVDLTAVASGDGVELHVRDTGEGFSPAFLPRAFDRFSSDDDGPASTGAGLGLSIVQTVAAAHGGVARAANLPGRGADVWLELPRST